MYRNKVKNYINKFEEVLSKISYDEISTCVEVIQKAWQNNKTIYVCGNGGSGSTASHFVTDWNKSIFLNTGKPFKSFSLVDNIGILTAYANDTSYENIFAGQLKNLISKGDVLICISGSGNSSNILAAVDVANKKGCDTIGLTGYDGGKLKNIVNYSYHVPINDMQITEDFHLMFGHILMQILSGYMK